MKPGIICGNTITALAGFLLASKSHFDFLLCISTILGLALVMGSACVFNNYIDRHRDQKMTRTKNRALVTGKISTTNARIFGTLLGLLGVFVLALCTNPLTTSLALLGFFVYVVLYSFSKQHTTYATEIGSIAGAIPPVVGYTAVSNQLDLAALLLFLVLVFWQMPHFFAIAMFRLDDYKAASIPVLPAKKGIATTKIQMLLYVIAFTLTTLLLTVCGYTGYAFLAVTTLFSISWLWLAIQGLSSTDNTLWAKKMFRFSLIVITLFSITIAL